MQWIHMCCSLQYLKTDFSPDLCSLWCLYKYYWYTCTFPPRTRCSCKQRTHQSRTPPPQKQNNNDPTTIVRLYQRQGISTEMKQCIYKKQISMKVWTVMPYAGRLFRKRWVADHTSRIFEKNMKITMSDHVRCKTTQ